MSHFVGLGQGGGGEGVDCGEQIYQELALQIQLLQDLGHGGGGVPGEDWDGLGGGWGNGLGDGMGIAADGLLGGELYPENRDLLGRGCVSVCTAVAFGGHHECLLSDTPWYAGRGPGDTGATEKSY